MFYKYAGILQGRFGMLQRCSRHHFRLRFFLFFYVILIISGDWNDENMM